MNAIRMILRTGSLVFGGSALPLISFPKFFAELLGLETTDAIVWSLRMTGVTVLALAGNMLMNSLNDNVNVRRTALVMLPSAALLGIVTLQIPGELTLFGWVYAGIGFAFSAAYAIGLARMGRR